MKYFTLGFTMIELLIVIAIAGILTVGLTIFVGRSFEVTREQFEQVRITEDGRIELERMSDILRNVRSVDFNGNGYTTDSGENWLQQGADFEITVYTNNDSDTDAERVRYFIDPLAPRELKVGIVDPAQAASGLETVTVLSRNIFNYEQSEPLFTYYALDGAVMTPPVAAVNLNAVARIGIMLLVDINPQQLPATAHLTTDISPRVTTCANGSCAQSTGTGCLPRENLALGPYFSVGPPNFAETGYAACRAHCATPGSTQACPASVSFTWAGEPGAPVTGTCSCAPGTPAFPLVDTVAANQYSFYHQNSWQFCRMQTGSPTTTGQVYCDPGADGLSPTGQCGTQCP